MRNSLNPYGGVNPLIDKMIGNAYDIVKYVARYLKEIRYVAENMELVYIAANGNRTQLTVTGDGSSSTLQILMPEDIVYAGIKSVDVIAVYEGTTMTFPGPDTFEFTISGGVLTIQLHSVLPQIELATYRVNIVHTNDL